MISGDARKRSFAVQLHGEVIKQFTGGELTKEAVS